MLDINKQLLRKVPQVTFLFWAIKLLTTAMGESTSDYFVYHINPYVAVISGFVVFLFSMYLQLRAKRYVPFIYWFNVLMVAVFGTMAADVTHVVLHVPYLVSTICFALVLLIVLVSWQKTEGTLSIHSINTRRRELFYWTTVLSTFALGTAAGDYTAYSAGLGFFSAGILFAAVFLLPALGYWAFKINAVFTFWFAYILTRPLGASFADWVGKPVSIGGLGIGDGPVVAVLALLILVAVGYLQLSKTDIDKSPLRPRQRHFEH